MNTGHRSSRLSARVPAIYVLLLCEVAESLGLATGELNAMVQLSREQLREADRTISIAQARELTQHAINRVGHHGLGFAYAKALRVTLHGPVSLIVLTSNNLLEVMQALERYFSLRAPAFQLHSLTDGDIYTVSIDYPGRQDPLRPFIMELLLMGLVVMTGQLIDRPQTGVEMHMKGEAPDYYAALAPHLPVPVRYQQKDYALKIPRTLMEAPLRLADPTAAAMAREVCERELQAQTASLQRQASLTTRVRSVLEASEDRLPTLDEVADKLHVSTRTLKRRLQEEGRNFRALVDHVLCERATQMLHEEGLTVSEVAYRLGYNDVSNFSRAFRRWTGQSPSDFRRDR